MDQMADLRRELEKVVDSEPFRTGPFRASSLPGPAPGARAGAASSAAGRLSLATRYDLGAIAGTARSYLIVAGFNEALTLAESPKKSYY